MTNNSINTKGLLYPNPCPHCGKENTKKGCYEFFGKKNGRKYGACMRGANPGSGWEQALTRNKDIWKDRAGNLVYQEIIPYQQNGHKQYQKPKAEYFYRDKAGNPLVKIARYQKENGSKYFIQYHYTSDGRWEKGVKGYVNREDITIYRYREVRDAIAEGKAIWVVEGEECVDILWQLGMPATCNYGGSKQWRPSDTECLAGAKEIVLSPDCDRPGVEHMEKVYSFLIEKDNQLEVSQSSTSQDQLIIKWFYVYPDSNLWDNLPESNGLDIVNWLNDGLKYHDISSHIKENKRELLKSSNRVYKDSEGFDGSNDIQDKLDSILYYEEEGRKRKKKITKSLLLEIIKIIYGDKLRYNLQTFEPWLDDKPFKDVEVDIDNLDTHLAETYGLEVDDKKATKTLLYIAKQNKFHPVEDYLRHIAREVAPESIDNLAYKYLGVDTELANTYLKLWILAAAARAIYPGCYVRNVLILQGKQNIGKSTFFRILGGEHFCDSLGDCKNKDQLLIAHRKHIHEWAEFEKLWRKSMRSEVKAFISATEDTFRIPYGRSTETFSRRFILCGTSNEEQFLKDPTGNDRFWIISVKQEIALEQLAKKKDAIWSAAVKKVLAANPRDVMTGKLWKLPEHLLEINKENTSQYEELHEWEDTIQNLMESIGSCGILFPNKILEELDIEIKDAPKHGTKINDLMTKLGWRRSKKRRRHKDGRSYIWIINNLSEEDVDAIWENSFKNQ